MRNYTPHQRFLRKQNIVKNGTNMAAIKTYYGLSSFPSMWKTGKKCQTVFILITHKKVTDRQKYNVIYIVETNIIPK